jgi:hypothetical protein
MTFDTVRVLIAAGIFMLLLLLRLEAPRFGAAEYDEPGRGRRAWKRLSWYAIGGLLLLALYATHPSPHDTLLMLIGHRQAALTAGLGLATLGVAQAAGLAWLRYGDLRFPPAAAYPNGAINAVGTAVIDEVTFRGALLGSLVAVGAPDAPAVLLMTIVYLLDTRLAAPGHHPYMPLLAGAMGVAFGWATLATGGLGAALVGHAATSFGVFVFTGHAGQVAVAGSEPEEIESRTGIPEGWQQVRDGEAPEWGEAPERGEASAPPTPKQ